MNAKPQKSDIIVWRKEETENTCIYIFNMVSGELFILKGWKVKAWQEINGNLSIEEILRSTLTTFINEETTQKQIITAKNSFIKFIENLLKTGLIEI